MHSRKKKRKQWIHIGSEQSSITISQAKLADVAKNDIQQRYRGLTRTSQQ